MARVQSMLHAEIDPKDPVKELSGVIAAVLLCNAGHEEEILNKLVKEIESHIKHLKEEKIR